MLQLICYFECHKAKGEDITLINIVKLMIIKCMSNLLFKPKCVAFVVRLKSLVLVTCFLTRIFNVYDLLGCAKLHSYALFCSIETREESGVNLEMAN